MWHVFAFQMMVLPRQATDGRIETRGFSGLRRPSRLSAALATMVLAGFRAVALAARMNAPVPQLLGQMQASVRQKTDIHIRETTDLSAS
jgi:hypothetical protein